MKAGLFKQLRALLQMNLLFSIDNLISLTGHSNTYISEGISNLQNPHRCGDGGPLVLKRVRIKRENYWGHEEALTFYDVVESAPERAAKILEALDNDETN